MSTEFIDNYAWIFWLALILIFVIIEVLTVDLTFLMLSLGSVGGLISGLIGFPWWGQLLVAAAAAVLLLFAVRPPLLRALKRGGDPARSNVDALIGLTGAVTTDFDGSAGHVKLANGETWTARLSGDASQPLETGDPVLVIAIEGATAVVVPAERKIP
ncbi:MAG TPA: NfeD family protein [Glaciihabitans sp.]|jgi:membrane protein implicated in regulation of membrane protease activity|nr:NfeD family protein [Glaciihabitans sp.]